jgi:hypothetical protein
MRSHFQSITLQGINCSAFIDILTANTFIMVVAPPRKSHPAGAVGGFADIDGNSIIANIRASRSWFEKIELETE